MGGSIRKCMPELGITPQKPLTVSSNNTKIWAFFGVTHAQKCLHNYLLGHKFVLHNGKVVNKDVFIKLVDSQKRCTLKYTYKLSYSHLILTGTKIQKIKTTVEILYQTVATAILHHLPKNNHITQFIHFINNRFDVLNSRIAVHPTINKLESGYSVNMYYRAREDSEYIIFIMLLLSLIHI